MSSIADQQFCVIGQHMENFPDLSSISPSRGGVSTRREHDDLEQRLEAKAREAEGGLRRPINLDLGCRSKLETPMRATAIRQSSCTSDFELTPQTELSPWNDLRDPEVDARERTIKHWTDEDDYPPFGTAGFKNVKLSLETDVNEYNSPNKGVANGVQGGVGRGERREGRDNDGGSDSDSGKGTVSDCCQSPTEEILLPESSTEKPRKRSLCRQSHETTADNGSGTIQRAPSASSTRQHKYERSRDDEVDSSVEVPCMTNMQRSRDSVEPELPYNYYSVNPDLSLDVTHPGRPSKVERYPSSRVHREEPREIGRFAGDAEFPGDVNTHKVIDLNNNHAFEFSSSGHDSVTPLSYQYGFLTSREFVGTRKRTGYCEASLDVFDADNDILTSRRELKAKCQDMYGSHPSVLGSQDVHTRFGSHQNLHDSRHDIHGSSHIDVYPRYEAQRMHRDSQSKGEEIRDSHCDISADIHRDADGCLDASSSSSCHGDYRRRRFQNNVGAPRGPYLDEFTEASNDRFGYNRSLSLVDSPSTEYSFGVVTGNSVNSTPTGRRYYRREPPTLTGAGAPRNSPQKGHRYTRKCTDIYIVPVSESDPEIFHEDFDKASPVGSHGDITPAQYRRIRSVPHDYPPAGLRGILASAHPALKQPFSDQEAVTLPRPAKSGHAATEQQVNSCVETEAKGHRLRPNRRWTNLGLSGAAQQDVDEFGQKTKTPGNQSTFRFRIPSLFRSRKDSTSTASRENVSESTPGAGTPVACGSPAGNGARKRGDRETGRTARRRSGNAAVESGFETGSSLGSVGDVSQWSLSLGSTQSVFDVAGETPIQVQGTHAPHNEHIRRSISVPNPNGNNHSSTSILDKLLARLTLRKKSSSSKDSLNRSDRNKSSSSNAGLTPTQNREEIQLAVLHLSPSQVRGASREQTEADGTDRCAESSMTTVSMTNAAMTTTFGTFTPTRPEESLARKENQTDANASSSFSPSAAQISATPDSFTRYCRMSLEKAPPPSEECVNAVSEMIEALSKLTDFVDFTVNSVPSTERTITEVEFRECRSRMIDAVKEFNQACKQLVIKTPQSEPAFLQGLHRCRQTLDDVGVSYNVLIDCTSLPADRSKVATPLIAAANSLRETVVVACRVAGFPTRDPVMLALRRSANRLVVNLGLLMKSVREMNYSRLSRRF